MYTTRASRLIRAPRSLVYRALLDPEAIARWRVPDGMTSVVHDFDPREGGRFRVSLTYDVAPNGPTAAGKSGVRTDTYHGHFVQLVPGERVVEAFEFETDDLSLRETMTMTTSLRDSIDGTEVSIVHEGIPDLVPRADNEAGTTMALAKLAALVEAGWASSGGPG